MATETVICTYRVRPGREDEFLRLLRRHWPTLRKAGLTTDDTTRVYRRIDENGGPVFIEIFTWKSREAATKAHQTPDVMSVWKPMGELCEERDGRPAMEFPHVQPVEIGFEET